MSETYTMPPQFPVVAEALASPIYRLRKALRTHHQLSGAPFLLNNFQAEWAEIISRNIDNVSAAVNQLGQKVMASDCDVTNEYARQMVASLDRTIAKYIYDTDTFLCRPCAGWNGAGKIIGCRHHGETPAGSSRSF